MVDDKITLVISRYWKHPQITVKISIERIALEMPVEDLLKALAVEVRSPSTILTRTQLEKELLLHLAPVLEKIKEASSSTV